MKLALYSDQSAGLTDEMDKRLMVLIGKPDPKIGYISSCSDLSRTYFNEKDRLYRSLGASDVFYFDLDIEYDEDKIPELLSCDAIHLSGGNTFFFLKNMKRRGFLPLLKTYVEKGGTLVGVSAGSVLMSKVIDIASFCDENEASLMDTTALGLVDFEFFPHFSQYGVQEETLFCYARESGRKIYVCNDGDGILINNQEIKFFGNIVKLESGKMISVR